MSIREDIAANIITVLDAVTSPIELKKITREPFEPEQLADPQFPAIYISTGDEVREDYTLGNTAAGKRSGTIDYVLVGYVKGTDTNLDTKRNQLIEVIEENGAKILFVEAETPSVYAETISQETGIKLVSGLYVETLKPNQSYSEFLITNVELIVNSLKDLD